MIEDKSVNNASFSNMDVNIYFEGASTLLIKKVFSVVHS